jgi:hypothetical protein
MILFEIPIPFAGNFVVQKIYSLNPGLKENQVDLRIRSVAVGWNYSINRPIILLKGVSYAQQDYSINLYKVGFYPSIANSFRDRTLYLQKVFVEGLNFIVMSEGGSYKITLDDKNMLVNNEDSQAKPAQKRESFFENLQNRKDFKEGNYYQLIDSLKSESSILTYLNEFMIYKSNVIFISQAQKLLILDIDDLSLQRGNGEISINLVSKLTFDNDVDRLSRFLFNGSIGSNNIIKWDMALENTMLSNVHKYVVQDSFLKELFLEGFNGTANLSGSYDTKDGLQDLNATAVVKDGSLTYKNYISNPLRIYSITSKLSYDKRKNILDMSDFNVVFANNNMFSSDKLGLNLLLNRLSATMQYNFNNSSFAANNITFFSGNNKAVINLEYLPESRNPGFFKLNAKTSNIDVGFVKLAWPKNYLSNIRKWIVDNVIVGKIDNSSFDMNLILKGGDVQIDTLQGDVFLSNAKTTYLKGLPEAAAKSVVVNYGIDETTIKYSEGTTGKIISNEGEIKFYSIPQAKNNHEYIVAIDLAADSSIENAMLFINNKPLSLLEPTGLNPSKFSGQALGDVKLKYSLTHDKLFDKEVNLHLSDVSMEEALPNLNVSGGDLKFLLNDSGLKINGIANALDEQMSLGVQVNWENFDNIIQTYSVNVNNFPVEKLNQLTFFDKRIGEQLKGSMDGNFTYARDNKGARLSFYNDLSNASFHFDFFDYTNKIGDKLTVEGVAVFNNNSLANIHNLKISADDLNINADLNFNENADLSKMTFNNFYIKNMASMKGSIDFANNMKSFDLKGSLLNIAPILSYVRGNTEVEDTTKTNKPVDVNLPEDTLEHIDTSNTELSDRIGNIRLKLAFDRVVNASDSLNNANLNLLWEDNFIKLLNFSARINNSRENSYVIFDDKTAIVGFRIANLGNFLRLLNFPSRIRNGDFIGRVNIEKVVSQQNANKFYIASNGAFTLNNFSVGVSFSAAFGEFRGKDLFFQIDKLELQGNLMGGNMHGYIDVKNSSLDIVGQLIPLWSINNIISNFPIFRPLFDNTPIPTTGQLVSINTRIHGSFSNIRYSLFTRGTQGDTVNELNITNNEDSETTQPENTEAKPLEENTQDNTKDALPPPTVEETIPQSTEEDKTQSQETQP